MKKIYTILALSFTVSMASAQATHTIVIASQMFSPGTVNAVCGDTVRWSWGGGSASSTSNTIPSGAASWNSGVLTTGAIFDYVVPVAGTYSYHCTLAPTTMFGDIVVTCPTGIASINDNYVSAAYPNPSAGTFSIENIKQEILNIDIYNVFGEKIYSGSPKSENSVIDISNQPNGIYSLSIKTDAGTANQKIVISH